MDRSTKEKFCIVPPGNHGEWKDKMLLVVNSLYEGDVSGISLQDLLEFLLKNNIDPHKVPIGHFRTAITI